MRRREEKLTPPPLPSGAALARSRGGIPDDDELTVNDFVPLGLCFAPMQPIVTVDANSLEIVKVESDLRISCLVVVQRDLMVHDVRSLDDPVLETLLAQPANFVHVRSAAILPGFGLVKWKRYAANPDHHPTQTESARLFGLAL